MGLLGLAHRLRRSGEDDAFRVQTALCLVKSCLTCPQSRESVGPVSLLRALGSVEEDRQR